MIMRKINEVLQIISSFRQQFTKSNEIRSLQNNIRSKEPLVEGCVNRLRYDRGGCAEAVYFITIDLCLNEKNPCNFDKLEAKEETRRMAENTMALSNQISISITTKRHQSYLPKCNNDKQSTRAGGSHRAFRFPCCTFGVLRRRLLLFIGSVPVWSNINTAFGALMPQMEEPEIIRTRKLAGGVRVQDIVDGEGLAASDGDVVEFNYVCRRANGYFVYSTVDQFTGEAMPVTLPLNENQMIKGLKDVIIGMKIGGKRRALIPPSMGYVNEQLKPIPEEFGPRRSLLSHANEPLVFEVQLLKIL